MRHERDTSKCPDLEAPCNSEIYVMNPDGSKQTRITNNPSTDYEPVWSPDGTKIAFVSLRDEPNKKCEFICNSEIYVIGVDGKNTTRLSYNQISDFGPEWQPKP